MFKNEIWGSVLLPDIESGVPAGAPATEQERAPVLCPDCSKGQAECGPHSFLAAERCHEGSEVALGVIRTAAGTRRLEGPTGPALHALGRPGLSCISARI